MYGIILFIYFLNSNNCCVFLFLFFVLWNNFGCMFAWKVFCKQTEAFWYILLNEKLSQNIFMYLKGYKK